MTGIGTYISNETITGSISGTTALVRVWDATKGNLTIYKSSGSFINGEIIVGSASSAMYKFKNESNFSSTTDLYAKNNEIEVEADSILDFNETNPFGNP